MLKANDVIDDVAELLGDPDKTYFTQAFLLKCINRSLRRICNESKTIKIPLTRAAVLDQYRYALPDNFLQMDVVIYETDPPLRKMELKNIHASRFIQTSGRPAAYDVDTRSSILRASGTATSGSATQMVDNTKDFTVPPNQAYVGDLFVNVTDDSEAEITVVNQHNVVFGDGLLGGTDNDVDASDSYQILSASRSLNTLIIHPAPSASDTAPTESIQAIMSVKHRVFDQDDIDNLNDDLEMDEEFESALYSHIKYQARQYEQDRAEANNEYQLFINEYNRVLPHVKDRVREFVSNWTNQLLTSSRFLIAASTRTRPSWYTF